MDNDYNRDAFSACHPVVNFYYFTVVIVCGMFFLHPMFQLFSFLLGLTYAIYLNGKKAVRFTIFGMLPMFFIAAIFNPLFSHAGVTILFYFPNGNPGTLESILYGLAMGGMLVTVITWLSCFNKVMSGDKLGYLFGKIIPALSLVFSMTLRFVPRFRDQIIEISNAQKCIGKGVENGKIIERFKNGIAILSILITWSLEDAIETSNSMKSRGYGLKGRTHFSIYQLEKRDVFILGILLLITIGMFWGTYLGITNIQFFPMIIVNPISFTSILIFIIFLILVSLPMILNVWEEIKWKSIK